MKSAPAVISHAGVLCGVTEIVTVPSAETSGPATSSTARVNSSDRVALADAPTDTSGLPPWNDGWPKPLLLSPVSEKPRDPPAVSVIPSCA